MNMKTYAVLGATLITLAGSTVARGEHDDDDDRGQRHQGRGDLTPVINERYRTECGGCHLAYQPALLPAAAWTKVMGTLDQHYGDDASLEPPVAAELLVYLQGNAANGGAPSDAGPRPVAGEAAPRITQTAFFLRKHDEVPARHVKGNPKVGSFSNCVACHPQADKADFDEDQVMIPGVGRFKD